MKNFLQNNKRKISLMGRRQSMPRKNSKATVTIVARLVKGLLIVMLQ